MKKPSDISRKDRERIDAYPSRDDRGQHVTRPDEDPTGSVFDHKIGVVPLTWNSHAARCRALGIQYGSDGPYFREPGQRS